MSRLILFYIWFRTKNPSAKPSLCSRVVLLCSFSHSNSSRLYTRRQQSTLLLLLRRAACNWGGALIIWLALALMPVCILVWYVAVCTFKHVLYSLSLFFGRVKLRRKMRGLRLLRPVFLFFFLSKWSVCVCLLPSSYIYVDCPSFVHLMMAILRLYSMRLFFREFLSWKGPDFGVGGLFWALLGDLTRRDLFLFLFFSPLVKNRMDGWD